MRRIIITILGTLLIMFIIGAGYASADPKAPRKYTQQKTKPIHEMICTQGSATEQIDCLNEYIKEVNHNIDFMTRFNASNLDAELKVLYQKACQDSINACNSQLNFMARNTPPGSYGEIKFLRYKVYLMLKLADQVNYMTAGPEQRVELN